MQLYVLCAPKAMASLQLSSAWQSTSILPTQEPLRDAITMQGSRCDAGDSTPALPVWTCAEQGTDLSLRRTSAMCDCTLPVSRTSLWGKTCPATAQDDVHLGSAECHSTLPVCVQGKF